MASVSGEAEPTLRGQARQSSPLEVGRGGAHGLGVGRGGANPEGSGEAKPTASVLGEAEPTLWGRARQSLSPEIRREGDRGLEVERGRACPQWLSKAEIVALGAGWSRSCALNCSDESMLMTISSSSSGTLVLVLDSSS